MDFVDFHLIALSCCSCLVVCIQRYSVIIFGQAHIPEFTGTIIIGLVNVASTFLAMKFIDKLGRKWLLLVGYVACNTGVAVQ